MASPVPDSPHVKFGPFELDPSTGRLLRSGIPLKLQPQPFRVLQLLTSRPGQVIAREEIQNHLWGDSTFVDFERGINFSINQIRSVLCDNAEKPRYIETLPRVGYRFIGTLEPSGAISVERPGATCIPPLEIVPPLVPPATGDGKAKQPSYIPTGQCPMGSSARNPKVIRFADCTLDLQTAELRRNGTNVTLQDQPFQILTMLLENPGQLVTREELTKKLWPNGTFVDFDQSLNKAVARLREALRDSAEDPRFVETLPRKGYRWIAQVQQAELGGDSQVRSDIGPRRLVLRQVTFGAIAAIVLIGGVASFTIRGFSHPTWTFYFENSRTPINSVAVLPFAYAGSDPSTENLTDGFTEGVIDDLSDLQNIKVISRASAFHYKQREINLQRAAKELGVEALVTGRVVQHGNVLSVRAELVDAREDKQLWGGQYSMELADIQSVQKQIATAISEKLRVRLTNEEKTRLLKPSPKPEAYQLYLKGRYVSNQATAGALQKGIEYFQRAIDIDPGYALAYVGLADSNNMLGAGLNYASPSETLPKAKLAAMKALELDETLGEAHAALAYAEWFYDLDWPSAEREFKRSIELNPNSAIAHQHYAECLLTRSRFDESIVELKKAQELDPLSPIADNLGHVYWVMRRYDEAISDFQKTLELHSNASWIRAQLAWTYALKRMYPQAFAEYDKIADHEKAVTAETQLVADGLGWLYAVAGRRADALKIVRGFNNLSSHTYVDFYQLATIYAGLGEKGEAFLMLEKGYEQHSASMPYLTIDPFWDAMRSDPRYADLLHRMELAR